MVEVVFLALVASAPVHAASCDSSAICNDLKNEMVPDRSSKGRKIQGRNMDELFRNRARACFSKPCSYQDPARIKNLFAEVKARLPNVIAKGRSREKLSGTEVRVIDELAKVQLLDPMQNKTCRTYCAGGGLGKNFDGDVCLCPVMELVPDESLIFTMAHEGGHRGDICSETMKLPSGTHPFQNLGAGNIVTGCLLNAGVQGKKPNEKELFDQRVAAISAQMIGAREGTWLASAAGYVLSPVTKMYSVQFDQNNQDCLGPLGSSELREASADVFGFEVLASFVKDYPLANKNETATSRRMFSALLGGGCEKESSSHEDLGRHPPDIDRVTKIGLSIPAMREVLGCSAAGHSSCDYQPLNAVPSEESSAKPPAESRQ